MSQPLATIQFTSSSGKTNTATLGRNFVWTCPDKAVEQSLNDEFPVLDRSPAVGVPGYAVAGHAAEWLKGTLHITPLKSAPAGVDY
jgi:hypothetical protein